MTLHHHLASSEPQAGGRILVVDADETTRALYRDSLIVVGCDVVEASDGRDALTKALVRRPTLVITEIELPLVDGYALCEILRRDRMTADVPILVVMADGRPANVERARRAGADTVFVKPTSIEKILDETRRLVADSKYARGGDIAPARDTPARSGEPTTRVRLPVRTRTVRTKVFSRFTTTTPPASPPALLCPCCDSPLTYERSHIGGVSDRYPEQWDDFVCSTSCGTFQYRHRTRKLRPVGDSLPDDFQASHDPLR